MNGDHLKYAGPSGVKALYWPLADWYLILIVTLLVRRLNR